MDWDRSGPDERKWMHEILGYLNYSSGVSDPIFLRNLNDLFAALDSRRPDSAEHPTWCVLGESLRSALQALRGGSEAFAAVEQAENALHLTFDRLLPAYLEFHRDLLFHQTGESLFNGFFIGRACEAVLTQGGPWNETTRIVQGAIAKLNDFIGHRPVAVLRTTQKIQPYAHEWVRPIPLYVRDAGAAYGRYREVIERAMALLEATDPDVLAQAWFRPSQLDELALDPRAYDFDHPAHRRPNYQFGGWDPNCIDRRGRYRRFVLQQVTLDALCRRVDDRADVPREEAVFEAAAVLAGVILMGSGIGGDGPEMHDSSTTLTSLVSHIAAYRDAFYERLLRQASGSMGTRLRAESEKLRQPFGGVRQYLNQALSRRRAEQLQHVHLALLYAQMGYPDAAVHQAQIVPVASARMKCEIQCRLTAAHLAIDRRELDRAAAYVPEIEELLHRAIECGAMIDPWNILGFGAHFNLFPAVEDSIHDARADELIGLMDAIFGLHARLERESAAAGSEPIWHKSSEQLAALARWWDKYATTEVSDLQKLSGQSAWESAEQVARALSAWRTAGTASGNIGFWRDHAEQFRSPEAYALIVEALLEQSDLVAAMALLMHWLSQAREIPLTQGECSFHALALQWTERLWSTVGGEAAAAGLERIAEQWDLARKFLDYLEANADVYWEVPTLDTAGIPATQGSGEPEEEEERGEFEEGSEDDLFGAAYENVTYRDTTDDGFEGEMLEGGDATTDFELTHEAERISARLMFHVTTARLWRITAIASRHALNDASRRDEILAEWLRQALKRRRRLQELLLQVHRFRIAPPSGHQESLLEYDRRQAIKESLLERIITAGVETADAARVLAAAIRDAELPADLEPWEISVQKVLREIFSEDAGKVRKLFPAMVKQLATQPLLYLPIARGGHPQRVVASRSLQQALRQLLHYLPRLGLLEETFRLLETVQTMERTHPIGSPAVTEFDRLFEIACRGVVRCIVMSSEPEPAAAPRSRSRSARAEKNLLEMLERAVELMLRRWLAHNRQVRLSVLETVVDDSRWRPLRQFIERFGADLFTQRFLRDSNVRAILHHGVDHYLRLLEEQPDAEDSCRLLSEIDRTIPREEAVRWFELTLEAVLEGYDEYIDYNTTTTQSDRGELLYILLDFLRVKASYDRVAWNLRPVFLAHEELVRLGRTEAAEVWGRAVMQRSRTVADEHLQRYERLRAEHGVRLRSVSDRISERFVQPLAIDRLRSWVRPAVDALRNGDPPTAFEHLDAAAAEFTAEPGGGGIEVPPWLDALEDEVQRVSEGDSDESAIDALDVPQARIAPADVLRQVAKWDK